MQSSIVRAIKARRKRSHQESDQESAEQSESDNSLTPPISPIRTTRSKSLQKSQEQQMKNKAHQQVKKGQSSPNQDSSAEPESMEMTENQNMSTSVPQVVDLATVKAMFDQLNENFKKLEDKVSNIEQPQQQCQQHDPKVIESINNRMTNIERGAAAVSEVSALKREMVQVKHRNKVLTGTVQCLHDVIDDLSNRLENIELNSCKKSITIVGLEIDNEKYVAMTQINEFFETNFCFKPEIEDFYTKGGRNSPIDSTHISESQRQKLCHKQQATIERQEE